MYESNCYKFSYFTSLTIYKIVSEILKYDNEAFVSSVLVGYGFSQLACRIFDLGFRMTPTASLVISFNTLTTRSFIFQMEVLGDTKKQVSLMYAFTIGRHIGLKIRSL